ncbi:LysR family transcriptional regulator [Pseudonocardia acaciae]|uniref:LysR family transcriptional regulator n=1 Tax=Pseudonocardia acaciae TaxID=551276 RepID=UPI00048D37B8|nr:LysR family transcriptional regulator [Pseudonocardia acaciae]
MGLDLFKLRVFVTVVDRHGYSAAAAHLGLSQATVSFHVHSLERQLGTSLVRYEHREVRLTPAGEQAYRRAVRMLRDERQLLRSIRSGQDGQVSLGASIAFEQPFFFERVLVPYRAAHPGVLASVRFGHSVRLAEQVLDHRLDLAYAIGWQVPSGVRFEPLHGAEFRLLVAGSHPLARSSTVTVDEVSQAGLITAPLNDVEWVHYEKVLREVGLGATDARLEVEGMQARVLAARAGMGVLGMFQPPYATDDPESLRPLRLDRPMPVVQVGLVHRRGERPTPAVRSLADRIRTVAHNP